MLLRQSLHWLKYDGLFAVPKRLPSQFFTGICHIHSRLDQCITTRRRSFSTSNSFCKSKGGGGGNRESKHKKGLTSIKNVLNERGGTTAGEDDWLDEEDWENKSKKSTNQKKSPEFVVAEALKRMVYYYNLLGESLNTHLTVQVNLKVYEDVAVTLENGETHRLYKLARISMRNPKMIAINFTDNPSAIKPARIAIQKLGDNVNVQQDGIVLYVPVPKVTRERREELAEKTGKMILNEYKTAMNEVYKKYTEEVEKSCTSKPDAIKLNKALLEEKRKYDKMGSDRVHERQKTLLTEIELG